MSLQACAEMVHRGDPDRFLATMAAPPEARAVLFPLYAFNLEVARAPWVTEEPMIAEMRLQWWRDALEEIGSGGRARRHEVVDALVPVLYADGAALLDRLVQARRWDIYKEPFESAAHFDDYLDATSGHLMWVAAKALGAVGGEGAVRDLARASGLANWFLALPELEARGRLPLVDGREKAVAVLADDGLKRLRRARRAPLGRAAKIATLAGWRAGPVLRQSRRHPHRVAAGELGQSEFARRSGLLWRRLWL